MPTGAAPSFATCGMSCSAMPGNARVGTVVGCWGGCAEPTSSFCVSRGGRLVGCAAGGGRRFPLIVRSGWGDLGFAGAWRGLRLGGAAPFRFEPDRAGCGLALDGGRRRVLLQRRRDARRGEKVDGEIADAEQRKHGAAQQQARPGPAGPEPGPGVPPLVGVGLCGIGRRTLRHGHGLQLGAQGGYAQVLARLGVIGANGIARAACRRLRAVLPVADG